MLSVDEKSQVQALERTPPLLPMGVGDVEGGTHDDKRHGTTTLLAALNVLNGSVISQCKPRPPHQAILSFLRHIEPAVPRELDVPLILNHYGAHKHPRVKAWLAARPRWPVPFVPTSLSWLNLVERCVALITDQAIRRGSFRRVRERLRRIDLFVSNHKQSCRPFVWTATAASILAKLNRLCERISGTEH